MGFLTYTFAFIVVIVAGLKLFIRLGTRRCTSYVCLKDKTVIVTGANSGIGYITALDFAKRGARVILACRSHTKAKIACEKIIDETGNDSVVVKSLNLISLASVRAFAKDINETETRLDILVNNAGAFGLGDGRTVDGLPLLMQVNYFSNVLLTLLLIDLMKKSSPSRIINVSSYAANLASNFQLEDLDRYVPRYAYQNSKLCNVLFTIELAYKLRGTNVTTYSLHPGFIESGYFHNITGLKKLAVYTLVKLFSITREEGAQTSLHCALARDIEVYNGEHFERCQKVGRPKPARDSDLVIKVWERTMEILNLKGNENPFRR